MVLLAIICSNVHAQNPQDDIPPRTIHLNSEWGNDSHNNDRNIICEPIVMLRYGTLVINQVYNLQYSNLYIVNRMGKVVLDENLQFYANKFAISLQGLPSGVYTLYLYEGNHFWYGTFTLDR